MFFSRLGRIVILGLLGSTTLALSACAAYTDDAAPAATTSAPAGTLTVTVASYPFEFVAERVGGDQVRVNNLTAPGQEPHDLELTAQQVAALSSSDLLVYQAGFQPAVDTAIEQASPRNVVDAATFLTLVPLPDESALDPHTWLDPTNLIVVAEHTRDALLATSPENPAQIQANTERLITELEQLDGELTGELTNCQVQEFVTSHAAFGYLARRYDLTQVAISGIEPDVEPSAARIAEVQQIAQEHGVTTIFFETLASPAVAQSIAQDLGLATDVLDPLEGITSESRGEDYLQVMAANGAALAKANQCQ